jgi:hypothetical protein
MTLRAWIPGSVTLITTLECATEARVAKTLCRMAPAFANAKH